MYSKFSHYFRRSLCYFNISQQIKITRNATVIIWLTWRQYLLKKCHVILVKWSLLEKETRTAWAVFKYCGTKTVPLRMKTNYENID
jgi:hypothetical protein